MIRKMLLERPGWMPLDGNGRVVRWKGPYGSAFDPKRYPAWAETMGAGQVEDPFFIVSASDPRRAPVDRSALRPRELVDLEMNRLDYAEAFMFARHRRKR